MTRNVPFIELDRNAGPTPAASAHFKDLSTAEHLVANGGQGSEQVDLPPELATFVQGSHKSYNAANGGPNEIKDAFVGWTQRMFGFSGHRNSTFVTQHVGRGLIKDFSGLWSQQYNLEVFGEEFRRDGRLAAVLVPRNSWALTNNIMRKAGFKIIEYDVDPDDIVGSFENALEEAKKEHIVAGAYFNYPHNATGVHLKSEENRQIKAVADVHNAENPDHKMVLFYDVPYFAACEKSGPEAQAYLEAGFEDVFDPDDFDPANADNVVTPVAIAFSGSKFFRTAQQGLSWIQVTGDIAIKPELAESGIGVRYKPSFFETLVEGLQEENDPLWQEQLDADREKFGINYGTLKDIFGDAVLPGGANLVALFRLEGVFNKAVTCHDGQVRIIRAPEEGGVKDLLEIVANGNDDGPGVVLVDGEVDGQGNPLGRISLASTPDIFEPQIARRTKELLDWIANSPDAPAA